MITIIDDIEKARRAKERMEYIRRYKRMEKQENDDQTKPCIELTVSRRAYYRRKLKEQNKIGPASLKSVRC